MTTTSSTSADGGADSTESLRPTTAPPTDGERETEFLRTSLARARAFARNSGRAAFRSTPRRMVAIQDSPDEPVFSGAHPDRRDPAALVGILDELVAVHGWHDERVVAGIITRWPDIVGPDVAHHISVESFSVGSPAAERSAGAAVQGTRTALIVLRADSTAWATQMRLLTPALRHNITAQLPAGVEVDIRVLAPAAPSWRHGSRHISGRGPRDTYG